MSDLTKRFDVVAVATDVVMLALESGKLKVLLIKPKNPMLMGKWALPGGMVNPDESVDDSVRRHLLAKAGIKGVYMEQLFTFGQVDRDPFGRVVSVAYLALIPDITKIKLVTSGAYEGISWHNIDALPALGYDHDLIIRTALERLRAKLTYTNIIYGLLPEEFTFNELLKTYELILDRKLDKRNFSKKIIALKLIKPTSKKSAGAAHRPAILYRFVSRQPKNIEIL